MKPPKKKQCKNCGDIFTPFQTTQKACGPQCAIALATKQGDRKRRAAHTKRKREFKANDRKHQLKLTQAAFNAFIRERDKGKPCISCGRLHGGKINAGHYRSVGAAPNLRLNQRNVFLQCEPCNSYLSGNIVKMRQGIVDRYGVEFVEAIEADETPRKFTLEELVSIRAYYKNLLKALKARNNGTYP